LNFTIDSTFLNLLESAAPTPGGGSAAAYAGAIAAPVTMATRTTIGKKSMCPLKLEWGKS
jgi:formiminotetrahydrofolate cyclodeaminase